MKFKTIFFILTLLLVSSCSKILYKGPGYRISKEQKLAKKAGKKIDKCIQENMSEDVKGPVPVNTKIDSIHVDTDSLKLDVFLSKNFSYQPFRNSSVEYIYGLFKKYLGRSFRKYKFTLFALEEPIERLVPNYFRKKEKFDESRLPREKERTILPIVQNENKRAWRPTKGLFNRNIALWHSHGFYYTRSKDRWEWQRSRLFCTVEDLFPMSFTIPYLIPMLENAGANVFLPRERSLQIQEVVVDNDLSEKSIGKGEYREFPPEKWQQGGVGFAVGSPPYPANLNPFLQGTFRKCLSDTVVSASVQWIPEIPETGTYSVDVSYHHDAENVDDAHYTVFYLGGKTEFLVNQKIGGGTWVHLGDFKFEKGLHPEKGSVLLDNKSRTSGKVVTADAVRFGGGMGDIVRGGRVSGKPRFAEAARYYLQYAGMPDTLVYRLNQDTSDYKDDYQSRAEFVNYLKGKPFGPNKNRNTAGLGIPIDLSLAFHTDAGIDTSDGIIGTLMIYSLTDAETLRVFPDGVSRLANRDLADILQTQIVNDIRKIYRKDWRRRALMDGDYSEVWRPNVPASLLELLSHQNFKDMQYGLFPQFRFDVARAIYKGMLRFLATEYDEDYVVQPLPVSHFCAEFLNGSDVLLRWKPVLDPLEPTAMPEKYVVYVQREGFDFDNGRLADSTTFVIKNLEPNVIYSFKVTAINAGGESLPSEILSVCRTNSPEKPVLIVNGFDRVSPPEIIAKPGFKGFATFLDEGEQDKIGFNFVGGQFDFEPHSMWRTNDAPGHGASHANFEAQLIAGNCFNYPQIHGDAIRSAGFGFVSCSDEAVMDGIVDLKKYKIVDLILGEEKRLAQPEVIPGNNPVLAINRNYQAFPFALRKKIREFFGQGGNLFVSGAHLISDLMSFPPDSIDNYMFARDVLKLAWQTDHAAVTGKVFCVDSLFLDRFATISFNTEVRDDIYRVESPDAFDPVGEAKRLFRYSENRFCAATSYFGDYGLVVFGFPFETIVEQSQRNKVMRQILQRFLIEMREK
ncbi:MAG: hypothetical protein GXO74_15540 [Calditrichaeota bacterium]|nr:hypothetical protein [Calditrichota bacterium]